MSLWNGADADIITILKTHSLNNTLYFENVKDRSIFWPNSTTTSAPSFNGKLDGASPFISLTFQNYILLHYQFNGGYAYIDDGKGVVKHSMRDWEVQVTATFEHPQMTEDDPHFWEAKERITATNKDRFWLYKIILRASQGGGVFLTADNVNQTVKDSFIGLFSKWLEDKDRLLARAAYTWILPPKWNLGEAFIPTAQDIVWDIVLGGTDNPEDKGFAVAIHQSVMQRKLDARGGGIVTFNPDPNVDGLTYVSKDLIWDNYLLGSRHKIFREVNKCTLVTVDWISDSGWSFTIGQDYSKPDDFYAWKRSGSFLNFYWNSDSYKQSGDGHWSLDGQTKNHIDVGDDRPARLGVGGNIVLTHTSGWVAVDWWTAFTITTVNQHSGALKWSVDKVGNSGVKTNGNPPAQLISIFAQGVDKAMNSVQTMADGINDTLNNGDPFFLPQSGHAWFKDPRFDTFYGDFYADVVLDST